MSPSSVTVQLRFVVGLQDYLYFLALWFGLASRSTLILFGFSFISSRFLLFCLFISASNSGRRQFLVFITSTTFPSDLYLPITFLVNSPFNPAFIRSAGSRHRAECRPRVERWSASCSGLRLLPRVDNSLDLRVLGCRSPHLTITTIPYARFPDPGQMLFGYSFMAITALGYDTDFGCLQLP
jgi:hypothetical protein